MALTVSQGFAASSPQLVDLKDLNIKSGVKQVSSTGEGLVEGILMQGPSNLPTFRRRCRVSSIQHLWLSRTQQMIIYQLLNLLITKVLGPTVVIEVEEEAALEVLTSRDVQLARCSRSQMHKP